MRIARRVFPLFVLLLCAVVAISTGYLLRQRRRGLASIVPNRIVTVAVLNVGHGEAAWIKTRSGKFIVIGTGPPGQGASVAASLTKAGAKKIDLLLLPYPYAEAIGGTAELANALPIEQAVEPTPEADAPINQWHQQMRVTLRDRHVPLQSAHSGQMFRVDGVKVEILAPPPVPINITPSGANDSLVVRVGWGKTAFLWAGGLEKAGENALLSRSLPLACDWLRVARFGTKAATSPEFLRRVSPSWAVVSVGPNSDGYPHEEALTRLEATGATVLRTDTQPAPLVFRSDGTQVFGPQAAN